MSNSNGNVKVRVNAGTLHQFAVKALNQVRKGQRPATVGAAFMKRQHEREVEQLVSLMRSALR